MKSQLHAATESKPARRSGPQARTGNVRAHAECQKTGEESPRLMVEQVIFTAGEHQAVQQQIERRARELWCAGGCCRGTAFDDWLQAEREVLMQFIRAYAWRYALQEPALPATNATRGFHC
jgi:hypothetical protein